MTTDAGSDASPETASSAVPDLGKDLISIDQAVALVDVKKLGVNGPDDPKFKQLSLYEKLAVEKAYQPANSLKSTTVYEALGNASIPITKIHQIAGFGIGANYCDRGATPLSVDVMVCEFRDDPTAIKSRALILQQKGQEGRQMMALKGSWVSVTVFGTKPDKASLDQQKKILDIVKTL